MAETPRTPQTLRIPFSTIAAQLPDDLFRMPAGEVGARLSTPDHVLVPVTLVLPQLAEGFVEVRWDAIGHQFPDSVLARPARETAARVYAAITLPLDEIVAQLPADLFADAGRVVDTTHLENFPLPFQPVTDTRAEEPAPEPVAATTATPLDRAAPAAVVARAHESPSVPAVEVEEPAPVIEPVVVQAEAVIQAETSVIRAEAPVVQAEAPVVQREGPVVQAEAPVVQAEAPMVQAEAPVVQAEAPMVQPEGPVVQAEAPVVQDQAPAIQDEAPVVQDEAPWVQDQAPVDDGDGVAEAVVEEEPYGLVAAEHAETRVPPRAAEPRGAEPSPMALREIRALFARLNRLEIDAGYIDGVTLYRACSPDVGAEAIRELAARLLPFLRDGWSGPVEQITVRGARAAIVLTALGGPDAAGPVLAAGTGRGPSLGLIELLGRRGAATWPTASAGGYAMERDARGRAGAARGRADASSHLVRGIVDTDLARLTPALAAFGHVAAACFDAADGARVYAFVDPDLAASGVAAFAHDLLQAVTAAEGARDLGRVESVTCRRGAGQLMVRAVTGGAPRLVVAAGAVARPGRAHGQLECAAAALGAGLRD
jgi:predicted regulator of Ras-like GTPase activity (Roadblock/LC7/MglB family)